MGGRSAAGIAFGAVVAVVSALYYVWSSAGDEVCRAYDGRTVVSPDGRMRAEIFKRDCGATTAEAIQISVLPRDVYNYDAPGNAFTCENAGGLPTGEMTAVVVNARWTGPDRLEIHYDGRLRVFERQPNVNGVAIRYLPDLSP